MKRNNMKDETFPTGRVTAVHRDRYVVLMAGTELEAEITGNMRFSARSREDFPVVGDWVELTPFEENLAIIHRILPRSSLLRRQLAGERSDVQPIAANIDVALILQSVDRDLSLNRLERYLTLCHAAGVSPVVILSKTDLVENLRLGEVLADLRQRLQGVQVQALSNETGAGFGDIREMLESGKTYCLLGSSGVGKSTLLNRLLGSARMRTDHISESVQRGRHVTTHRELFVLENGAMIIDNPGMREVGIADAGEGLEVTFDRIMSLSRDCRYPDCTHTGETGCAVLGALQTGDLDQASYENWLKLEKERTHFESSAEERRKKDRDFGKMLKNYKKGR